MKVITIKQPWASLVALGEKTIETRSWNTHYRGPLLIHSSKNFSPGNRALSHEHPFCDVIPFDYQLPLGAIIAVCDLTACHLIKACRSNDVAELDSGDIVSGNEFYFGDYTPGRYAWMLENVKMLDKPIPAKGSLGFWNYQPVGGIRSFEGI